jgi:hypothetical protein
MIDTIAGILLILAMGACVVAFPFVLWMLFASGPRHHARRISGRRGNGFARLSEARKKKPRLGTTGLKSKATSIVERVSNTIIAGTVHAQSVLEARRPKFSGVVSFSSNPKSSLALS